MGEKGENMNILREDGRSQTIEGVGGEKRSGPPPLAAKGGHGHRSPKLGGDPSPACSPATMNYVIARQSLILLKITL